MISSKKSKLDKLLNIRSAQISTPRQLIERSTISERENLLVIKPKNKDLNLFYWLKNNFGDLKVNLNESGGILFRGFRVDGAEQFGQFISSIGGIPMEYKNRSSPRSEVLNNIYTSTDYPKDQKINMHNEMDYDINWPMKIAFYCQVPASEGGETPIVDSRKVYKNISAQTRYKFKGGIKYVRNLTPQLGLSVEEVFQTKDRDEIEQFCLSREMVPEWIDEDHLRISWTRPAIRIHPITKEKVWFNHGFFFNFRTLDPGIHRLVKRENLPYNTYYANGEGIEESVIEELRDSYETSKITFTWQEGDILLLDNMLMAHSRNKFLGERKILVAMSDPRF